MDPVLLRRTLDALPDSIMVTDVQARIVYVNRRFTEMTGYAPAEVLGQNPRLLASGQTTLETYSEMWATIVAGRVWTCEILDRKASEELYWARLTVIPLLDETRTPTHYIGHQVDISHEKQVPAVAAHPGAGFVPSELGIDDLRPGMVLRGTVHTRAGITLLRAGCVIDELVIRRLTRAHAMGGLAEPLSVDVPR